MWSEDIFRYLYQTWCDSASAMRWQFAYYGDLCYPNDLFHIDLDHFLHRLRAWETIDVAHMRRWTKPWNERWHLLLTNIESWEYQIYEIMHIEPPHIYIDPRCNFPWIRSHTRRMCIDFTTFIQEQYQPLPCVVELHIHDMTDGALHRDVDTPQWPNVTRLTMYARCNCRSGWKMVLHAAPNVTDLTIDGSVFIIDLPLSVLTQLHTLKLVGTPEVRVPTEMPLLPLQELVIYDAIQCFHNTRRHATLVNTLFRHAPQLHTFASHQPPTYDVCCSASVRTVKIQPRASTWLSSFPNVEVLQWTGNGLIMPRTPLPKTVHTVMVTKRMYPQVNYQQQHLRVVIY